MLRRGGFMLGVALLYGVGIYFAEQPSEAVPLHGCASGSEESPAANRKPKKSIVYVNDRYGFKFYLPKSWKGYSIIVHHWEGGLIDEPDAAASPRSEYGPTIVIRHPLWKEDAPWQDIRSWCSRWISGDWWSRTR